MGNIIKIKHGNNPPSISNLENYELGYSESDKGLYTKSNDVIIHLNDTSEIEEIKEEIKNFSSIVVSETEPENTKSLWIDISENENINSGIAKYYDENSGTWVPIAATWG